MTNNISSQTNTVSVYPKQHTADKKCASYEHKTEFISSNKQMFEVSFTSNTAAFYMATNSNQLFIIIMKAVIKYLDAAR
jgi:hypothetical protein